MTVKEVIAALSKLDPNLPVVTDDHSEFGFVTEVAVVHDFFLDNGGYVARAYRREDKAKVRSMVYITADRTGNVKVRVL